MGIRHLLIELKYYFRKSTGAVVHPATGVKQWLKDGVLHREDGPAAIWPDGTLQWYYQGKLHRDGGPAIEMPDGHQEWYQHGQRHREDGPAVIRPDGSCAWWLNGAEWPEGPEIHRQKQREAAEQQKAEAIQKAAGPLAADMAVKSLPHVRRRPRT